VKDEEKPSSRPAGKAERERRLAEALRANLKRRKAATRPATENEARRPEEDADRDLE
jgi:hypothetical protein